MSRKCYSLALHKKVQSVIIFHYERVQFYYNELHTLYVIVKRLIKAFQTASLWLELCNITCAVFKLH